MVLGVDVKTSLTNNSQPSLAAPLLPAHPSAHPPSQCSVCSGLAARSSMENTSGSLFMSQYEGPPFAADCAGAAVASAAACWPFPCFLARLAGCSGAAADGLDSSALSLAALAATGAARARLGAIAAAKRQVEEAQRLMALIHIQLGCVVGDAASGGPNKRSLTPLLPPWLPGAWRRQESSATPHT